MMGSRFLIVLFAFFASLAYVVWHLWRITPGGWVLKLTAAGLFLLWMALAFAGFGLTERVPVRTATILYEAGHPWLIAFLYLLLVFFLADVASLCHLLPKTWLRNSATGLWAVLGLTAVILVAGSIHYRHKYREEMTIQTEKPLDKPLTIVLASDLHVGYHNRKAELGRWVDLFNAEHPDLVLIGGDIIDRSIRPVLEGDYAAEFRRLEAPVWTILGNHEYYSNEAAAERFFEASGIHLLRDEVRYFSGIRVIGRDDRTNPRRKSLSELADTSDRFTILLDHQPYRLEEAERAGVDFQFSGHTHHGQVWPVSWVTDALFEKAWGPHQRGRTRYYVSSGIGIWGPKIRIGTRSEFLVLHIVPRYAFCSPGAAN